MDETTSCERVRGADYLFGGQLAPLLHGVTEQWLKIAPLANPAMLEMFRDRDCPPLRDLLPWSGEFAGKYLTSAVQILRLTGDPELHEFLSHFVDELTSLQAADGYLGPFPLDSRLLGEAPRPEGKPGRTWDAWGHYHVMLGLLLWFEESGEQHALAAARKIGDLFCDKFLGRKKPRLVDTGSTEMNMAPIHSLCLLYRHSHSQRHLDLAMQFLEEFGAMGKEGPLAGDYLNCALAGKEFCDTPKPRWESLHPILGLVELYRLTGNDELRRGFEQIWWSIVGGDRHNNGGFTSGERATGNPYDLGAIETCCTVAWMAMSVEMLRLTGNSIVADELELSTLNSVLGYHSQTGRWVTYDTPMDGVRKASAHHIVFQAREGSPELNCCSVNGPRGLGLLSDWALMQDAEGLILNWYGPSVLRAPLAGHHVTLTQQTEYPRRGRVELSVEPSAPLDFTLKLRIPYWSAATRVTVNGERLGRIPAGDYCCLARRWQSGDRVVIDLDMSLHFWAGKKECAGKTSVFRGPILLAYDPRFGEHAPDKLPALDAEKLRPRLYKPRGWMPPALLLEVRTNAGERLKLCDFASAGEAGTPYISWLPVKNAPKAKFSPVNPLRSARL